MQATAVFISDPLPAETRSRFSRARRLRRTARPLYLLTSAWMPPFYPPCRASSHPLPMCTLLVPVGPPTPRPFCRLHPPCLCPPCMCALHALMLHAHAAARMRSAARRTVPARAFPRREVRPTHLQGAPRCYKNNMLQLDTVVTRARQRRAGSCRPAPDCCGGASLPHLCATPRPAWSMTQLSTAAQQSQS